LPLLCGLATARQDRVWHDAELEPLAEGLAAYFEARSSTVGLDEARTRLLGALQELRVDTAGEYPLRHTADLGRALWASRDHGGQRVRKGKVTAETLVSSSFTGDGLEYAYRLPKEYDPKETSYPLIVAIPDAGERPAAHLRSSWTLRAIQGGAILVCPAMPAEQGAWTEVMVEGRPGGLSHVLTALRIATERFAVDFDRVYVAGHGKGVPAAVAAGNYSPQRFAGIVGRAGDTAELGPENFSNLPTYFAGAGGNATAFGEAGARLEFDNITLAHGGKEEDVWSWILDHPRRTYPELVNLVVGTPFPTRAYWLRVAPIASDARATATLDRKTNSIRITAQGISYVTLYLNDALVDLDRPVTVTCNEVEHTVLVEPRLSSTLDLIDDGTSDAASVYVAEAVFDATGASPASSLAVDTAQDTELRERMSATQGDPDKLWELYEACSSSDLAVQAELVLKRIVCVAPDHEPARAALGHRRSMDQWFTTQSALERFERSQDEALAKAKGHIKQKGVWMHPDERPFASRGCVKDQESGQWLTLAERRQLSKGWVRQDLEWIPPEEAARVDAGLWKVDGEWFDLMHANRRHARIHAMWSIPSADVLLYSTANRDVALLAMQHMSRAVDDLRRVFGTEPVLPLRVAVLRDEEQYDRFAFGDPDGSRPATHAGRLHVIHSAFFAESWLRRVEGKPEFMGMGVCLWDADAPYGNLYGIHSARLAAGLSFVDALDPSPKAVRKALGAGAPPADAYDAYEAEKLLPAWLRYGGAVYAERYFRDSSVAPDADPWWARQWSLDNLKGRGGLRDLDDVFAFRIDPDDSEDGLKLLIEAGLVVAFVVDGACAPVAEAHAKFKRAMVAGKVHANDVAALQEAVAAQLDELRAFAGE
jgi:poly(3-hydroxybutyrate) depolymerase